MILKERTIKMKERKLKLKMFEGAQVKWKDKKVTM